MTVEAKAGKFTAVKMEKVKLLCKDQVDMVLCHIFGTPSGRGNLANIQAKLQKFAMTALWGQ